MSREDELVDIRATLSLLNTRLNRALRSWLRSRAVSRAYLINRIFYRSFMFVRQSGAHERYCRRQSA